MFTTLTPGAAPQQSGPVFDGPFLEGLGLSLAHFPLCKSLVPFLLWKLLLISLHHRVREIPQTDASRGIHPPPTGEGAAMVAEEEGAAPVEEEEAALAEE